MSTVVTENGEGEDIEDLEDVDEGGVYVAGASKKIKMIANVMQFLIFHLFI